MDSLTSLDDFISSKKFVKKFNSAWFGNQEKVDSPAKNENSSADSTNEEVKNDFSGNFRKIRSKFPMKYFLQVKNQIGPIEQAKLKIRRSYGILVADRIVEVDKLRRLGNVKFIAQTIEEQGDNIFYIYLLWGNEITLERFRSLKFPKNFQFFFLKNYAKFRIPQITLLRDGLNKILYNNTEGHETPCAIKKMLENVRRSQI